MMGWAANPYMAPIGTLESYAHPVNATCPGAGYSGNLLFLNGRWEFWFLLMIQITQITENNTFAIFPADIETLRSVLTFDLITLRIKYFQ